MCVLLTKCLEMGWSCVFRDCDTKSKNGVNIFWYSIFNWIDLW